VNNLRAADPDTVWDKSYEGYSSFTDPPNKKTGTGRCPFGTQEEEDDEPEGRQKHLRAARLVVPEPSTYKPGVPYVWPDLPEWSRHRNAAAQKEADQDLGSRKRTISSSEPDPDQDGSPNKNPRSETAGTPESGATTDATPRQLRSATRRLPGNEDQEEKMEDLPSIDDSRKRVTVEVTESEPAKRSKVEEGEVQIPASGSEGPTSQLPAEVNPTVGHLSATLKEGVTIFRETAV
jgi:hypothetical protein